MQSALADSQHLDLLVEFLTEELPPAGLRQIGLAFLKQLVIELKGFLDKDLDNINVNPEKHYFVTPRRFGVLLPNVANSEPSKVILRKGPAISNAFKDEKPTPALLGFLKSCQLENYQDLEQKEDGYFYFEQQVPGKCLADLLPNAIGNALKKIPIAKAMRWGDSGYQFIRPVHNLVILYGDEVIGNNSPILGLVPVNYTYGHRFMSKGKIIITNASNYCKQMENEGQVIVNFSSRNKIISDELNKYATKMGLNLAKDDLLLDEVTGLVEFPVVLSGSFDPEFLKIPQECLILSMAKNQRYFALLDQNNKLTNQFLFVANIKSTDPQTIIDGNQKVLSARLNDAKFFYEVDKKHTLEFFADKLNTVLYHNKLGTQGLRAQRLQNIAQQIALMPTFKNSLLVELAKETALLLKADLTTEMVGEFPELQGVMGKYYALNEGKSHDMAIAIEEHYLPRHSGGNLPSNNLSIIMALTDKLETLVGIWGIGLIPTGEKDPFALRRSALGVVRILLEGGISDVKLDDLLRITYQVFIEQGNSFTSNILDDLYQFILTRLENSLIEVAPTNCIQSIIATKPNDFSYIKDLVKEVEVFAKDSNNSLLLNANKRITNILAKNQNLVTNLSDIEEMLLVEDAEKQLYQLFKTKQSAAQEYINTRNWSEYFKLLSEFNQPIDAFFKDVMVICDDESLKINRINMLFQLSEFFNQRVQLSFLN